MRGAKCRAPSGQAVSPAGLSIPAPISLDRPTSGCCRDAAERADADAAELWLPEADDADERSRRRRRRRHEADVSVMGLTRVDTVLEVVANLSEPINRFWLSDSGSLQTWVGQELTANVDVAIEALVFSTLGGTSGVQTAGEASTDAAERCAGADEGPERRRQRARSS